MGYVKRETVRLELPSDPQFWVEIKAKLSHGDENYRLSKVMDVSGSSEVLGADGEPTMQTKVAIAAMASATLERGIVAWNLTDEADNPLLLTHDHLELLDGEDADYILSEINERNPRRKPKQKNA